MYVVEKIHLDAVGVRQLASVVLRDSGMLEVFEQGVAVTLLGAAWQPAMAQSGQSIGCIGRDDGLNTRALTTLTTLRPVILFHFWVSTSRTMCISNSSADHPRYSVQSCIPTTRFPLRRGYHTPLYSRPPTRMPSTAGSIPTLTFDCLSLTA